MVFVAVLLVYCFSDLKTAMMLIRFMCQIYVNNYIVIGSIPLRHLVYRVLDLPPSMDPLLYDFGQVTGKPEKDYITQIVTNHVSTILLLKS